MENISLESKVSLKEAYLNMFHFLDEYYERTGKRDDIAALLGYLNLNTNGGEEPFDAAVFPDWLASAEKILVKTVETGPNNF